MFRTLMSRRALVSTGGLVTLIALAAPAAHASQGSSHATHQLKPRPAGHAAAAAGTPLLNHGGPVQNAPRIFIDYWGWSSDPSNEQPYLNQFLTSIGGTPWLDTVNQYGGGSQSTLLGGVWSDPAAVPAAPSDAQIQAEAKNAANHFGTGTSVNVQIVVATPTGHSTPGFGTQWCAYHGAIAALPNVTYTDLPYMTDAGANCGQNILNGGSQGTLDGVSIVEGHEMAETITDPLLNAWIDSSGAEIGDKCAWTGIADLNLNGANYAVQPLWSNAANGCWQAKAPVTDKADFNADHKADLGLVGANSWTTLPTAFSNGGGGFNVTNQGVPNFGAWASTPGVKVLTGDFNGDGRIDYALTGGLGWTTMPVAFSNGDGNYTITNLSAPNFPVWATSPGAKAVTGDFNGDGKTDIALTGGLGWASIPVAFSNGDGSFNITNSGVANFPTWATSLGAQVVAGDFNADGKTDLALTGGVGWASIPTAFSNGAGGFNVTNGGVPNFGTWANSLGVKIVAGDFNGDGRTDIALTAVSGWASIPVAFSNGDGNFTITNAGEPNFPIWASSLGAHVVAGDFNGDGRTDLALTGGVGWASIPVATSNGDGSFGITNAGVPNFGTWANSTGVSIVAGDFNGDGKADIALTGVSGWTTVPMATSTGGGNFSISNAGVANFPAWATTPGARIF
jgi:hypothetical protein